VPLTRLVAAAALAGLIAGILLTSLQSVTTEPLIRQAERYESATARDEGWSPQPGWQRTGATLVANVTLATGFALLLAAGMTLRAASGVRAGVLWAIAGYAAFFVSPAIGLPPELPGSIAAPLHERELWWLAAVVGAVSGLWLIAFGRKAWHRAAGLALVVAPHLLGAPHPPASPSPLPAGLAAQFVWATLATNAVLWLVLGATVGLVLRNPRRI
jgi:cobalt transporter subunit CbtA